ncbi:MAG TPA: class I SAM-dependent methyltransferase [Pseudolabrys sp.]|nr:class I SAM-dependent methyltransferase [Pseudolabrys sp.]
MKSRLQSALSGGLSRVLRIAQLGAVRVTASAASSLQRKARHLEVKLDGLDKGLAVHPVTDIAWPSFDLVGVADPVKEILSSREFETATQFFTDNPAAQRSLVSGQAQALLYCIIRNLRPDHVFEIGSYKAGTTEALCRALQANGHGLLHTVDPFRGDYVAATIAHWPAELCQHVKIHSMSSMDFYMEMERQGIRPGVVFVDGNHDYEFALFDIGRAAKYMAPGGFIFVDNVAQPGPFFAARDFLSANPGWREIGGSTEGYNASRSFDRKRSAIPDTDFIVLRAPGAHVVGDRPTTFGRTRWWSPTVKGIELQLDGPPATGLLDVQLVLRGFGSQPVEMIGETSLRLHAATGSVSVPLEITLQGQFTYFTVEPWLVWRGDQPLAITVPPKPY